MPHEANALGWLVVSKVRTETMCKELYAEQLSFPSFNQFRSNRAQNSKD
jgi:hypothetical protein